MDKQAKKILEELLNLLGVPLDNLKISSSYKEGVLKITIQGEDVGNLIGYQGSVIYALQSLLYSYFSYKEKEGLLQVYLDIGDYRKKREEQLLDKIKEAIRIVRLQKREYKFLPMKPSERRLIHLEVSKHNDLVSYSVGEGFNRRVVISLSDLS